MTCRGTEGCARAWGGVRAGEFARELVAVATSGLFETPQKRPPVGRGGRCPGKPGGGLL